MKALGSFRTEPSVLLAAAEIMASRVGRSALGEVRPEGHLIDTGTWSFDKSPIRKAILQVTCLLPVVLVSSGLNLLVLFCFFLITL